MAVEQLQVERLEFEHRMKDLHHQMDGITQERENILAINLRKWYRLLVLKMLS